MRNGPSNASPALDGGQRILYEIDAALVKACATLARETSCAQSPFLTQLPTI